jgi:hypothetical protein
MRAVAGAVLTLCALTATAGEPIAKAGQKSTAALEEKPATGKTRRTISLESGPGASVPTIHVAKGRTTTLMFDGPIKSVDLLDVGKIFAPPPATQASKTLYLTTLRDPGSVVTTLVVVMATGSELPFQLVGTPDPNAADVVVDIANARSSTTAAVAATEPGGEGSSDACSNSVALLRQELDECRASTGADALRKIAQLILTEDATANSQSVVFEGRRSLRTLDKQSGLLVEATGLYRLFGNTYLLLTVENRLADRSWVLDKAQVRLNGAGADLPVISTLTELAVLPPSETEKIVVLFTTPAKRAKSSIAVTLLEKSGNRHVTLDGIDL